MSMAYKGECPKMTERWAMWAICIDRKPVALRLGPRREAEAYARGLLGERAKFLVVELDFKSQS